ncbi:MAG: DUF5678 domain-containing protein [Candidatus Thermoplasmatota archaeon]
MWKELRKYRGMWVAVSKDKVIASGSDANEVYRKAKNICKDPIIFQVPRKEEEVCVL